MLHTGVDIIEIARVERAITLHGERFLNRVFTAQEQQICGGRLESLAGRFAAKEAVSKALSTGIWRNGVTWTDIEVLREAGGAPHLLLHGAAAQHAQRLQTAQWSVSISHDRTHAIAFVVAL